MKITINPEKITGKIKPMNAVNNGPYYTKNADQNSTNLPEYKAAGIPFARTHDSSICYDYGGEHTVDIINIFKDFDADANDPASYDFALTDEYLKNIALANTAVFYRLGNKIEHWSKHYGILPPKDAKKWAEICEHIIMHYNEGWADGFKMGILYWEIWNEPDFNDKCWYGTPEEFYELFSVTAKHLKKRFPKLKIGGPAVCTYNEKWLVPFFEKMQKENVPMDFYSWHCYAKDVNEVLYNAKKHRALLDSYGYKNTESILNEWNYVKGWSGREWDESLKTEASIKGAAFASAVMTACQHENIDMLMYYDARILSRMNGIFNLSDFKPGKTYYPIKAWGEMLKMQNECETLCDVPDIYAASAVKDEKFVALITYYTDSKDAVKRTFKVETPYDALYTVYLLDEEHNMAPFETVAADCGSFTLTLEPNTVVLLKPAD